jgi:purine-nucleoside phosphorylase
LAINLIFDQLNAGITTQLLLSYFKVEGILHYGIAGNANPDLQIGDVTIPQYWAHTGLWNWQVLKFRITSYLHVSFGCEIMISQE